MNWQASPQAAFRAKNLILPKPAFGEHREPRLSAMSCRLRCLTLLPLQTGCCRSSFAAEWRRLPKAALHTFSWRTAALLQNLTFAAIVEENRIQ